MISEIQYDPDQKKVILLVIFLLMTIGLISKGDHPRSSNFPLSSLKPDFLKTEPLPELIWELKGLVGREGIYYLPQHATLKDGIRLAKGLKKETYLNPLDLGMKPENGSSIIVGKTSIKVEKMGAEKLLALFIPLSLNKASKEDFIALPGIGEKIATNITEYRKNYGPFSSVEELKNVRGIGDHKLKTIREYIVP